MRPQVAAMAGTLAAIALGAGLLVLVILVGGERSAVPSGSNASVGAADARIPAAGIAPAVPLPLAAETLFTPSTITLVPTPTRSVAPVPRTSVRALSEAWSNFSTIRLERWSGLAAYTNVSARLPDSVCDGTDYIAIATADLLYLRSDVVPVFVRAGASGRLVVAVGLGAWRSDGMSPALGIAELLPTVPNVPPPPPQSAQVSPTPTPVDVDANVSNVSSAATPATSVTSASPTQQPTPVTQSPTFATAPTPVTLSPTPVTQASPTPVTMSPTPAPAPPTTPTPLPAPPTTPQLAVSRFTILPTTLCGGQMRPVLVPERQTPFVWDRVGQPRLLWLADTVVLTADVAVGADPMRDPPGTPVVRRSVAWYLPMQGAAAWESAAGGGVLPVPEDHTRRTWSVAALAADGTVSSTAHIVMRGAGAAGSVLAAAVTHDAGRSWKLATGTAAVALPPDVARGASMSIVTAEYDATTGLSTLLLAAGGASGTLFYRLLHNGAGVTLEHVALPLSGNLAPTGAIARNSNHSWPLVDGRTALFDLEQQGSNFAANVYPADGVPPPTIVYTGIGTVGNGGDTAPMVLTLRGGSDSENVFMIGPSSDAPWSRTTLLSLRTCEADNVRAGCVDGTTFYFFLQTRQH